MPDILTIVKPDPQKIRPVVFDSPHSGTMYPKDFKHACSQGDLESTEDRYVDDLFESATDHGGTFLTAHFARSYIDVNRSIDDIDPALIEGSWPADHEQYGEIKPTPRSAAGIGLIRRLIKPGVPVYERFLSPKEIKNRIEKYYIPYHKALADILSERHYDFGKVWHINCHSMPASSAVPRHPIGFVVNQSKQADFCLGTRDGTTSDPHFTNALREFLSDLGYTVTINDPFKGVTLIGAYAAPAIGRNSIQLEINRSLYMDENTRKKTKNYPTVKEHMAQLVKFCTEYADSQLKSLAAD